MKNLKIILVTTCISFTLVILTNCFIGIFTGHSQFLSINDIFQIAITCLSVSLGIFLGTINRFYKEHFYILSYFVMVAVVFTMEFMFRCEFDWLNALIEIIALTLIYLSVCFLSFHDNEKDAEIINEKLKNRDY